MIIYLAAASESVRLMIRKALSTIFDKGVGALTRYDSSKVGLMRVLNGLGRANNAMRHPNLLIIAVSLNSTPMGIIR